MAEQTQAKKYSKPLPHLDEENRPWWEALQRHELYIQKCGKCGDVRYYPRALCTNCMSSDTQWIKCSGRGKIYTFTTTYQNQAPRISRIAAVYHGVRRVGRGRENAHQRYRLPAGSG